MSSIISHLNKSSVKNVVSAKLIRSNKCNCPCVYTYGKGDKGVEYNLLLSIDYCAEDRKVNQNLKAELEQQSDHKIAL